mmetsp:Transcript_27404/g.91140  ORF Transcript_27404/g.91140 Transcript_27404/m.91140 type:complete len:220 (+) Transcript_27404:416-1075(+)
MSPPTYSDGERIVTLTRGSLRLTSASSSLSCASASGERTSSCEPSLSVARSGTVGEVRSTSMSCSCCSRCWTTSRWSSPRKPQRRPCPSVGELSGSTVTEPSLRRNRDMACCSASKPSPSRGYIPAKTIGCGFWKPGSAGCGAAGSEKVSPTLASWMCFMPRATHATCPAARAGSGTGPAGRISSICWTAYVFADAAETICDPRASVPSSTCTRQSTPR